MDWTEECFCVQGRTASCKRPHLNLFAGHWCDEVKKEDQEATGPRNYKGPRRGRRPRPTVPQGNQLHVSEFIAETEKYQEGEEDQNPPCPRFGGHLATPPFHLTLSCHCCFPDP
ncbi:hypothetical protein H8959_017209 [Pygathrix nigripes]